MTRTDRAVLVLCLCLPIGLLYVYPPSYISIGQYSVADSRGGSVLKNINGHPYHHVVGTKKQCFIILIIHKTSRQRRKKNCENQKNGYIYMQHCSLCTKVCIMKNRSNQNYTFDNTCV